MREMGVMIRAPTFPQGAPASRSQATPFHVVQWCLNPLVTSPLAHRAQPRPQLRLQPVFPTQEDVAFGLAHIYARHKANDPREND